MKRINHLLTIILLGVGFGLAQGTSAQPSVGIGIGPGSEPATTSVGLFGAFCPVCWIVFADEPFSADPGAGVWRKILPFQQPTNPVPDALPIGFGDQFFLLELVGVGDGPAWRDWHETILTPDWGWGTLQDGISLPNIYSDFLQTPIPGLDYVINGADIAFTFAPLDPGSGILIVKVLECTGQEGCSAGSIVVDEYPSIPEPATLALLGLGLAGLGFSRRKQ